MMTKQRAHKLLHHWAHSRRESGWSFDDFIENFEQCWGQAPDDVTEAAALVPEALEHVAQVVWFPTDRTR